MSEWRTVAEWDWVRLPEGDRLHAPGWLRNEHEADATWTGDGETRCGRLGVMFIPGIGDRLEAPRCRVCCKITGMPRGHGSPKNSEECRPVVEARLGRTTNA